MSVANCFHDPAVITEPKNLHILTIYTLFDLVAT